MEYTLYDNYDIMYTEMYESFKEYCYDNGIDYTQYPDDSTYFFNWVNDTLSMEWDDFEYNLKHSDECKQECVVLGSVGLWHGRYEIAAKKFDNLLAAIYACIKNVDYTQIIFRDGRIDVTAIHHDGHHSFSIYKLNKKGRGIINTDKLNNESYYAKYKSLY